MARTIRTAEGDILDTLCQLIYGYLEGTVETVLAANPGLAAQVQPYPSGLLITFPDLPARRQDAIQLWA
ncbi:phage tail protein [Chitinimonas arctica]|uniref:Phage tail protein n=1 Tax=Chitinimonas arctica TaxID=2594795 RepID=A0A516S9T6_9NEIS|nr:tail protein X [Chitinimonas arctica]QDQ24914.1 phage tail protein [Chitinimonas arctica]